VGLAIDCPGCGSAGSIRPPRCDVCDESYLPVPGAADLPPAAPGTLRFEDVIRELRSLADAALGIPGGARAADVATRAEALLRGLRAQFLAEVVTGRPAPVPSR